MLLSLLWLAVAAHALASVHTSCIQYEYAEISLNMYACGRCTCVICLNCVWEYELRLSYGDKDM